MREAANRTASTIFSISHRPDFPPVMLNTATLNFPPIEMPFLELGSPAMCKFAPTEMQHPLRDSPLIQEALSRGTLKTPRSQNRSAFTSTCNCARGPHLSI